MTQQEQIITFLKEQYKRDLRKQIVKAIQDAEADKTTQNNAYNLINQIFSYVLQELGWNLAKSSKEWDDTPMQIMKEVFPKLEQTRWYQEQQLSIEKVIEVQNNTLSE